MNNINPRITALTRPLISALTRARSFASNAFAGRADSRPAITSVVPADFDRAQLRTDFLSFKDEVLAAIGNRYLLAVPMEALPIVEKHSLIMGIDHSFLFEMGPILAGIRDKVPEDLLSINAFRLEILLQTMGRPFTPEEETILDIVTGIAKEAGYKSIRHLTEVSGVTIFYPDGRVVDGGKPINPERNMIE